MSPLRTSSLRGISLHYFRLVAWFLLTPVATLVFWTLCLVIALPLFIARKTIELLVRHQDDTISSILSPTSTFAAPDFDSWTTRPNSSLAVLARFEGDLGLREWRQVCLRVVEKRDSNTNELAYPELQQCVVKRWGYLFFKWDSAFDIANHVKYYSSPDAHETTQVDEDKLMEIWAEVTHRPFNTKRSPWDILIIRNYVLQSETKAGSQQQSVVIFRFHHCLGDGLSLIRLGCEASDAGVEVLDKRLAQYQLPRWFEFGLILKGLILGPGAVLWDTVFVGLDTDNELHSETKRQSGGGGLHIVSGVLDVCKVKQAKNRHGVSFFAVLLAGLSGGIRNFMTRNHLPHPESPFKIVYSTIWPRHSQRLTNQYLCTSITLPVDIDERSDRLQVCQERATKVLQGGLIPAAYLVFRFAGILPLSLWTLLAPKLCQDASIVFSEVVASDGENRLEFADGAVSLQNVGVSYGLGPSYLGIGCSAITSDDKLKLTLSLDKGTFLRRELGEELLQLIMKEVDHLGDCNISNST